VGTRERGGSIAQAAFTGALLFECFNPQACPASQLAGHMIHLFRQPTCLCHRQLINMKRPLACRFCHFASASTSLSDTYFIYPFISLHLYICSLMSSNQLFDFLIHVLFRAAVKQLLASTVAVLSPRLFSRAVIDHFSIHLTAATLPQ
jgi:hypothetical protein